MNTQSWSNKYVAETLNEILDPKKPDQKFKKLITGVVINIKFPEIKSAEYIFNYYHRDYVTNGGEFVRMKDSQKELESSLDNFIKSLNK